MELRVEGLVVRIGDRSIVDKVTIDVPSGSVVGLLGPNGAGKTTMLRSLYRALRRTNPSPFLFHLDFGTFTLVGSSPEILVRVRDGEVTIRPLAGTIRRGATPEEDKALEAKLLSDPKERAEHLMLVDLGRNDVGRVAKIENGRRNALELHRFGHFRRGQQAARRR